MYDTDLEGALARGEAAICSAGCCIARPLLKPGTVLRQIFCAAVLTPGSPLSLASFAYHKCSEPSARPRHKASDPDEGQAAKLVRSRAHPGQPILNSELLAQGARQCGQPSARPVGADALVPDHLCGKVQSPCRRRPVHNACAVTWQPEQVSSLAKSQ